LKGKLKFGFGDQVQMTKPPTLESREKKNDTKKRTTNDEGLEDHNRKPSKKTKVGSVLDADEMEGIKYQPRTRETRQQYEALLHFVRQKLGDQPQSVIMSAADEVLAVLKDEEIKPKEKQGLLEELLNALTQDNVSDLFRISNAITDYTEEAQGDEDEVAAVVFGEEDSEDGVLDVEGEGMPGAVILLVLS
jgi:pre-mRNA-splicing helicase BRR2